MTTGAFVNVTATSASPEQNTYRGITTAVASSESLEKWKDTLFAMEVVVYILASINVWLMVSTIAYGTKTGRWCKKPGSSSLGSGRIFVACVGAMVLTIPKFTVVILLYVAPKRDDDGISCAGILMLSPFLYFVSLYGTYVFLWILQRQIYGHPSVKRRVAPCVNRFSKVFFFVLTVGFGIMGVLFWIFGTPIYSPENCMVQDSDLEREIVLPLTVAVVLIQIVMVALCLYPAFRARFSAVHSIDSSERHLRTVSVSEDGQQSGEDDNSFKRFFHNISFTQTVVSPIHSHVKRSVISAMVILFSDIIASIINICVPKDAPVQVQWFSYDVNLVVNVFCMVATFGYAPKIFLLFCPSNSRILTKSIRLKKSSAKSLEESNA